MKIVDTDKFLDMPSSAQALYFHLIMRADDDGFVSAPKKITKIVNCGEDDLKLLIAKGYLIPFGSGVCVITHWRIHNYIQKDRYQPTVYTTEKNGLTVSENDEYILESSCIHSVAKLDAQDRLGKDRLELEIGEGNIAPDCAPSADAKAEMPSPGCDEIVKLYNAVCISFPKITKLSEARKKAIKARLKKYSLEDFRNMFTIAEASTFLKGANNRNWTATFDWFMKDTNFAKVLDGNYNDRSAFQTNIESNKPDYSDEDRYKSIKMEV